MEQEERYEKVIDGLMDLRDEDPKTFDDAIMQMYMVAHAMQTGMPGYGGMPSMTPMPMYGPRSSTMPGLEGMMPYGQMGGLERSMGQYGTPITIEIEGKDDTKYSITIGGPPSKAGYGMNSAKDNGDYAKKTRGYKN